jgi:lipopolysaccharide/colanic/teichoic acid biosynthesis glycosyltransferase
MNIINKIAKVHTEILIAALILFLLLVIPKVMAMSTNEAVTYGPYRVFAVLAALGGALIRFMQRRFSSVKRMFDILIASISILLTLPLVIISAIAIKIFSPNGSVFYTQQRVGKNGRIFDIYKLRSMQPDAESLTGVVWSSGRNDPRRIPYIGNFLRKTHIDEIPQFINVLKGDMSVVGPRPERPELVNELEKKIPEYQKRLSVHPGITGLAQIRHSYDKTLNDVRKKVKLDLLYIRKMCFLSELSILLKTLLVVFKGKTI